MGESNELVFIAILQTNHTNCIVLTHWICTSPPADPLQYHPNRCIASGCTWGGNNRSLHRIFRSTETETKYGTENTLSAIAIARLTENRMDQEDNDRRAS